MQTYDKMKDTQLGSSVSTSRIYILQHTSNCKITVNNSVYYKVSNYMDRETSKVKFSYIHNNIAQIFTKPIERMANANILYMTNHIIIYILPPPRPPIPRPLGCFFKNTFPLLPTTVSVTFLWDGDCA